MKVDLIHIGYHKTASTYLQKYVFSETHGLRLINSDHLLDKWFFDNFINVNAHEFNANEFKENLKERLTLNARTVTDHDVMVLSDENLSGDIYTGLESRELMSRIDSVFGYPDILIVIRNQKDYILSAYSNYVLHGGTKSIQKWLNGQETRFGLICKKLKYSHLVGDYINVFGKEKVHVLQYEKLFEQDSGICAVLEKFGVSVEVTDPTRVNAGRSLMANRVLASMNKIGLGRTRGLAKMLSVFGGGSGDRRVLDDAIPDQLELLRNDNVLLEDILGVKLDDKYSQ